MAEFIKPIIETAIAILQARTPALLRAAGLDEFVDFGQQFTGVAPNFPSVWVMPARTVFDADSQHMRHQAHQLQIKFGVSGTEPDDVTAAAMGYMQAIDGAIGASDPEDWQGVIQGGAVLRVFVQGHDYGALFERGGAMARFPELELIVETEEL
ncbi:hypothetical protein LCGC14_1665410 [marine sediment metagenome]|uniref:Uncharacterized protein n=1 Tax=marine sediment metagenome TaxID=412755 RepID=A0A0F9IFG9_9ZZZZ